MSVVITVLSYLNLQKIAIQCVCILFPYPYPHRLTGLFFRETWYYSRVRPIGFEPTTSCFGDTHLTLILLHLGNLCELSVNQFRTSFETYTT